MAVQHLFDSSGNWIAFSGSPADKYVFSKDGEWIGWLPWKNTVVVDQAGKYLGEICQNRLIRRSHAPYLGYPGYPGYPGYAGYFPLPLGFSDTSLGE
jgi:hypothetical protein